MTFSRLTVFLFLAVSLIAISTTYAIAAKPKHASSCYSNYEVEAEQGIRIHSELMVIGLTCRNTFKSQDGGDLYAKYREFSDKHAGLIQNYEKTMMSYYRRNGEDRPDKALHALRTSLANKISQHAAEMNTVRFCKNFAERIDKALAMEPIRFRKWAQYVHPTQRLSRPICEAGS